MLTAADMKWFIDPLADVMRDGDSIYVTTERIQRGIHIGKIVETDGLTKHGSRMWRKTKGIADHVYGPVANSESAVDYNGPCIGWQEHEGQAGWMVGRFVGQRRNRGLLVDAKRADQKAWPVDPRTGDVLSAIEHVDVWFQAAPWALELMPDAIDCEDEVQAKLALAKQRWEHRHAKVVITEESMQRGYHQLDELIESGHLPTPSFGALYSGDILLPAGRPPARSERTVALQERIDNLSTALGSEVDASGTYMSVRVSNVPLSISAEGRTGINSVASHTIRDAVQTKLNQYEAQASNYVLTPILRSLRAA